MQSFNIQLFTTFYNEKKKERQRELLTCLEKNLTNTSIDQVTVFNEGADLSEIKSQKLKLVPFENRPTYQDFITYINKDVHQNSINIIANTDIYFDENIAVLRQVMSGNQCFALSRWDTTEGNKALLYNHNDSQDAWIFKGAIKSGLSASFPLGVPRCDNRLVFELQAAGYKVKNPAFSIKAYHMHKGQRALVYTEADNVYKIPKPYRYIYPHNLYDFWKTLFFNLTSNNKLGTYRYDIKKINNWWPVRLSRKIIEILTQRKMPLIGYK